MRYALRRSDLPAVSPACNDDINDGYITAAEWPAFNLKSDLLVLSACETGLGKVVSGEGVQGLPYVLYVAGNQDTAEPVAGE